jgi:hypothetical protein
MNMPQSERSLQREREEDDERDEEDSSPSRLERAKMILEMVWIAVRLLRM